MPHFGHSYPDPHFGALAAAAARQTEHKVKRDVKPAIRLLMETWRKFWR